MKRLAPVLALLTLLCGCNRLSGDFEKSGRLAFVTLTQVQDGSPVLSTELSRVFAETEAAAKTDADRQALEILKFYRDQFFIRDGSPSSDKAINDCRKSAEDIFMHGADPAEARKPCTQAINARGEVIMKQLRDEDSRK